MYSQLSKLCPECKGYILGDYNNCPYCGLYLKGRKNKIGFYTLLFIIFFILMILAFSVKGRYHGTYKDIQPYIDFEKTLSV